MGNQCGCAGEGDQGEISLKSKNNKNINYGKFDPNGVQYDTKDEQSIVRIQANFKGAKTRKGMRSGDVFKNMLVNDSSLVFKDGFTFNNGSTYKGQGKD